MRWDLFCRVIDNYGDIGVCWRLAAELGARGEAVRLWVDDASALAWMAPLGAPGVSVGAFDAADEPGDVVVEAFGCDPPPTFVARMHAATPAPVWINLEYLSAEAWVERSHGLPSPQPGGLTKWFFFPGFTPATGGLPGPGPRHPRPPGPRRASVFCYPQAPLEALAAAFDGELWLTPGAAQRLQGPRTRALPFSDQPGYDRLLQACDVNFVRGEDSLVRALWAGAPFVWQIYPQHDGVHRVKLEAFLALLQPPADVRALWLAWNGFGPWPDRWPDEGPWRAACDALRTRLAAMPDLVTQLKSFVSGKTLESRALRGATPSAPQ